MTRQMADDEVLRVIVDPEASDEQMFAMHDYVAALQAERDALRDDNARLRTAHDVVDASARRVRERAERAESALEALRGQVAGLVEKWRLEIEEYDTQNVGSSDPEDWMSGHRECLGELLAMKNSGEF